MKTSHQHDTSEPPQFKQIIDQPCIPSYNISWRNICLKIRKQTYNVPLQHTLLIISCSISVYAAGANVQGQCGLLGQRKFIPAFEKVVPLTFDQKLIKQVDIYYFFFYKLRRVSLWMVQNFKIARNIGKQRNEHMDT